MSSENEKPKKKKRLPILGLRLGGLRNDMDMSQAEFASHVGLTAATVGYYENSDRLPDAETLLKICKACGCTSDYLLGLSGIPKGNDDDMAIEKRIGLNGGAIESLLNLKEMEKFSASVFIQHEKFPRLLEIISQIIEIDRRYKTHSKYVSGSDIAEEDAANIERALKQVDKDLAIYITSPFLTLNTMTRMASDIASEIIKDTIYVEPFLSSQAYKELVEYYEQEDNDNGNHN